MTVGGGIQERDVRRESFGDRSYVWVCMLYVRTRNEVVDESVITCGRQMRFPKWYKFQRVVASACARGG